MDIKRGDTIRKTLAVPLSVYEAGLRVYFMAKNRPDNDMADTQAVIKKELTDTGKTEPNSRGVDCRIFELAIDPADTNGINFCCPKRVKLVAEFELRYTSGKILTLPSKANYLRVTVYSDIRRGNG